MVKGIEHVGIFGKDTKALAEWYCENLGFEIVFENGNGVYFIAAPDKSMIEICVADTEPKSTTTTESGIRHIALATDNIEGMSEKMIAAGVEVVTPLKVAPSGTATFFFRDPEGNILHFIQRPSPLV